MHFYNIKSLLLGLICVFSILKLNAQLNLTVKDTTICKSTPFQVCANISPVNLTGVTVDDKFSGVINIGFSFNYFGPNYTQLVISENNFVTFNLTYANVNSTNYTYDNSSLAGELTKSIMFPYQDLDVSYGGSIRYMTTGQAPNRKFVIEFCDVRYYTCNNMRSRNQLILYETSNHIEMHTGRVDYCTSWPAFNTVGNSVQGIRNNNTQIFIPNRTPTSPNWTLSQANADAYRFTPSGSTYTYAPIPYSPIPFIVQNQGSYSWYAGTSTTPFASTVCATITPSQSTSQYIVKYVGPVGCGSTTNSTIYDTVNVHYSVPTATKYLTYCQNQLPTTWNGLSIPAGSTTNANFGNVVVTGGTCDTNFTINLTVNPNVIPTFTQIAPICAGVTLAALPTTSTNGIVGTWSPALNNTATTTYTFTPSAGQCASTATMTITVNPSVTPTFTQIAPICAGATLNPLPTTSNNGIAGTWSPAINNNTTTTYTFTPNVGQCANTASMTIVVNPIVTANFTQVPGICIGGTLTPLPTTSTNGISGTWSPIINNTATTTYTFTPNAGQCALGTTMTIAVNNNVTPTFTQVAPICAGATLAALPTSSTNGIVGTWSPAVNNNTTTTYTFTPSAGQCANTTTMTITVNPMVTPTFTQVAAICAGATLNPLPTTSNNGIAGTWSPAINNTSTTTYTFTPTAGVCTNTASMTIVVNPIVTPSFTQVPGICVGGTLTPLPTTSNNGIAGTWSPAINNTATTTYTFTPNAGQCAVSTTMTIAVNTNVSPTFTQVAPICAGATLAALPTTSTNGIVGTWLPAINNTSTTTYTFTPNAGQCAVSATLTITVNPIITPSFNPQNPVCAGTTINPLPTTSLNGITGTWSPALNNLATTTYTFTPNAGQQCVANATMQIVINPYLQGTRVVNICQGQSYTFNGITYTNSVSGVKDTIANSNACDSIITLQLTVRPITFGQQVATICDGNSYTFNGITYTTSNNTAKDTLINQWGCDSIVTLNLTVVPVNPITDNQTMTGCGQVVYGANTFTANTQFVDTILSIYGCDSVYKNVTIEVYPEYAWRHTIDTFGCDAVHYKGNTYYQSTQLTEQFTSVHGCDSLVNTVNIEIHHFELNASIYPENPYAGELFEINTSSNNGQNYNVTAWNPAALFPDQNAKTQRISLTEPQQIIVTAESRGCVDTAIVNIADLPIYSTDVVMPNAFSPNGDGLNDVFRPVFKIDRAYSITVFKIFNRYGQLIHSSSNMNAGWDGTYNNKMQDVGVYYYLITIKFMDGTERTLKGDVTLTK